MQRKFLITKTPLEKIDLKSELRSSQAGALTSFEGWVRNHNEGHAVERLEYEAFEPLCYSQAELIFNEAIEKYNILHLNCYHRVGMLNIGEMAVWVGVSSVHRDDAFKACRYIIDQIKVRLPIWKKEYYKNGDSGWVNCEACAKHAHSHH